MNELIAQAINKGAAHDNHGVLQEMVAMEDEGQATFKNNWSLKELL